MTVVTFASLKGAPGVTTTACLVGGTWPGGRRVIIAECDPAGGDLAARFALSSQRGWPSFVTAVRRGGPAVSVIPHLQQLPGGLDVLVGTHASGGAEAEWSPTALLAGASSSDDGGIDVLVDVGRLHDIAGRSGAWLDCSDVLALVLGSDAASVLHVHEHADSLRDRCGERIGLVLMAGGSHQAAEIEQFVGISVFGELPHDAGVAAVATGTVRGRRRLERSRLTSCARQLAEVLVTRSAIPEVRPLTSEQDTGSPIHDVPDVQRHEVLR